LVIYCHLYFLQNVAKSEDNFPDVIALPDSLSMFGCEILCYTRWTYWPNRWRQKFTGSYVWSALFKIFASKRIQLLCLRRMKLLLYTKQDWKVPTIVRKTENPLPTIYGVLKRFKQRGTVENEERSGRQSLLTPRDTQKLTGIVKFDRKRPLNEATFIFNEHRDQSESDQTVQRKL